MSRSISQSFPGGAAYSSNHAYSRGNAYTASHDMDSYGFDGFPGNPMLSEGLNSTRSDLLAALRSGATVPTLLDLAPGRGWGAPGALPPQAVSSDCLKYSAQVRSSLAQFELLSSVSFQFVGGTAILKAQSAAGLMTLVDISRPSRACFDAQVMDVDSYATKRASYRSEVMTQVAPPIAYFASVVNLQAARHRRTLELIDVALQFAYATCMQFKHALACPRPSEYSSAILPMVEVPGHPSFPSGHANEAHVTAAILQALLPGASPVSNSLLRGLALRIANNRVIAGLHFPVDGLAGRLLGDALGSYFLACCSPAFAKWHGGTFNGPAIPLSAAPLATDPVLGGAGCAAGTPQPRATNFPVLGQMWLAAQSEWS